MAETITHIEQWSLPAEHPIKLRQAAQSNEIQVGYSRFVDGAGDFDPAQLAVWRGENVILLAARAMKAIPAESTSDTVWRAELAVNQ